jgi:serine/threonine protein kinase
MINLILNELGVPVQNSWPFYGKNAPLIFSKFSEKQQEEVNFREKHEISKELLDDEGYDLLMSMLDLNPASRISSKNALMHKYL